MGFRDKDEFFWLNGRIKNLKIALGKRDSKNLEIMMGSPNSIRKIEIAPLREIFFPDNFTGPQIPLLR